MPSNIRPKDFENYLPQETDTVAQGLVKFAQFAILFWRWFRSEFTSTGEWGHNIKSEMCTSGCLDAETVDPEDTNDEDDDDDEPDLPISPGEPIDLGNGDCCKKVVDYGKAGDAELDFEYFNLYDSGGTDLMCDAANRKQVGIRNASGYGTGFQSNSNWENAVKIWMRRAGGNFSGRIDSGLSDSVDMADIGEVLTQSSSWLGVEVFMYGTSEEMGIPTGASPESKIGGYFQANHGADNEGAKIPFLIENGGVWGVRFVIHEWPMRFIKGDGFSGRSFRFHINRKVPDEFKTSKKDAWWPSTNPYLCRVSGIRMSLLGGQQYLATIPGSPVQVGVDDGLDPAFVVYDERWQNEIPCFKPSGLNYWNNSKALAYSWTKDGQWEGMYQVYPHSFVNEQEVTNDLGRV